MDGLPCKVSCIVPFYNERNYIRSVLEVLQSVEGISQVICVDDGSTDESADIVSAEFPQVELVRLEKNHGKSHAVKKGLEAVTGEYVLLIDADLKDLSACDISKAIDAITSAGEIDMIILRRLKAPWFIRMYRIDTLLSGERLLRTCDLRRIFNKPVDGYQLEIAINLYMYRNKKKVFWSPSSAVNTFKFKKQSPVRAIAREMIMYASLVQHAGLMSLFGLMAKFGKQRVPAIATA